MVRTFVIVAVLAALTLALSLVTLRNATPRDGGAQVRFLREMIQHHSQAVDMAIRIRDRSADPALRTVALDMTLAQQDQIGQMRGWMTQWNVPWAGPAMTAEHAREMGMATPSDVASLSTLPVKDAEVKFLRLMIRHHEGALAMAEPMLNDGRAEIRTFARTVKATQSGEIALMKTFLEQRGASANTTSVPTDMPEMNHSH